MKRNHIMSIALAGLAAMPAVAQAGTQAGTQAKEPCCQQDSLLQKMDLLNPACDAPQYKIKANQKLGTQWHIDLAYGTYVLHRSAFGDHVAPNYALIHGNLNQRIIKDDVNGGTWLHAEFLGSWGLEKDAVRVAKGNPLGPLGSVTRSHAELVGPSDFYFPEISVKHFFNGKKAAIIAGTLRLSDYFDVVGIASDTYTSFMNSGFWHSTVLPFVDSNVGAIVQVQLGKKDYVMAGVSRTGTEPGYDPINSDGDGYVVMGEWDTTSTRARVSSKSLRSSRCSMLTTLMIPRSITALVALLAACNTPSTTL